MCTVYSMQCRKEMQCEKLGRMGGILAFGRAGAEHTCTVPPSIDHQPDPNSPSPFLPPPSSSSCFQLASIVCICASSFLVDLHSIGCRRGLLMLISPMPRSHFLNRFTMITMSNRTVKSQTRQLLEIDSYIFEVKVDFFCIHSHAIARSHKNNP